MLPLHAGKGRSETFMEIWEIEGGNFGRFGKRLQESLRGCVRWTGECAPKGNAHEATKVAAARIGVDVPAKTCGGVRS